MEKQGPTHTLTYDVEGEVAAAADVASGVLGAAVVQAVVVRAGALEGERPLLVVDLVALLRQLHPILEPLARGPGRGGGGKREQEVMREAGGGGEESWR